MTGGADSFGVELFRWVVRSFSLPSGTEPMMKVLFLFPNQLPLFFLVRLGWSCEFTVADDPGRSDLALSEDWKPRNLRTEDGRRPVGLVGEKLLALSFVVVWWRACSPAESDESLEGGVSCW